MSFPLPVFGVVTVVVFCSVIFFLLLLSMLLERLELIYTIFTNSLMERARPASLHNGSGKLAMVAENHYTNDHDTDYTISE